MRVIDILHAPWAIRPDRLIEINEIYARHLRGEKISAETIQLIEAQIGKPLNNEGQGYDVVNGVAVMPLHGVISKRMNLFTKISGGTSSQLFTRDFNAAVADPSIKAVIVDADTPGGTVDGTQEGANAIYAARGKKPIIGYSGGMVASAGYWYLSATEQIYISGDTVDVGSIGVVTSHTDYSKAYESQGIKVTEITAGKYKRIASEHAPLTESGREYIQAQLDHIYGVFLADVGRNRGGISADQVHDRMADGRIFIGTKAIDAGLVDGVSTLDGLINSLAAGELPKSRKVQMVVGAALCGRPEKAAEAQTVAGDVAAEIEAQEAIMDLKELKEKHGDLVLIISDEGKKAGIEEGMKLGAAAELARIKSVKAVAMPGHEAAIESFMFDGKTTGEQAAVAIVTAENAKRQAKAEAIKADGEDLKVAASAEVEGAAAKSMKRAEFNKLAPMAQAAYIQDGGKVTD